MDTGNDITQVRWQASNKKTNHCQNLKPNQTQIDSEFSLHRHLGQCFKLLKIHSVYYTAVARLVVTVLPVYFIGSFGYSVGHIFHNCNSS